MKHDYEEDDYSLNLNLGFPSTTTRKPEQQENQSIFSKKKKDEPSLRLTLSGEAATEPPVSSYVKRERGTGSCFDVDVDVEVEVEMGGGSEEDNGGFGVMNTTTTTNKLRLTKPQSALLERSFKLHTTLNPKQKQALADRLNLRPRQVEVWFQNRRARTKVKQTEVDREHLRKYCETLRNENRRLEKEVEELKAMKVGPPGYMHLPAATLTICPSCQRIGGKSSFSLGPKTHRFFAPSPNRPLLVDN